MGRRGVIRGLVNARGGGKMAGGRLVESGGGPGGCGAGRVDAGEGPRRWAGAAQRGGGGGLRAGWDGGGLSGAWVRGSCGGEGLPTFRILRSSLSSIGSTESGISWLVGTGDGRSPAFTYNTSLSLCRWGENITAHT